MAGLKLPKRTIEAALSSGSIRMGYRLLGLAQSDLGGPPVGGGKDYQISHRCGTPRTATFRIKHPAHPWGRASGMSFLGEDRTPVGEAADGDTVVTLAVLSVLIKP